MADNNILLLGGLAVGGYFLYQYLTGLPSDAQYVGQVPAGTGTMTLPGGTTQSVTGPGYLYYSQSANKFYVTQTAPTTAQQTALTTATSTAATGSTSNPGQVANDTAPPPPPPPSGPSLDSLYTQMKTSVVAHGDPNFTGSNDQMAGTPYHWNVYLGLVLPSGDAAPDPAVVFPGVDLTQPMTAATYWAGMGPALAKAYGLSGLGVYAGLGAYLQEAGVFPYGWN